MQEAGNTANFNTERGHMGNVGSVEDNFAARLERFIAEWNAAAAVVLPVVPKWAEFFDGWRKLAPKGLEVRANVGSNLDPAQFAEFAAALPNAFREYRQSGAMLNVWSAAQLGGDEKRNCKVLATFLDCSGDHGQGSEIFCRLLSAIELPDFARRAANSYYYTRTEVWPLHDPESRVDIEIEGDDFLIFIEAKIAADEAEGQLQRYLELAQLKAARRDWVVIYLTPDGRSPADDDLRGNAEIKPMSWSQVSRSVRSCALDCPESPIRHLLFQYAEFVGSLG